VIVAGVTPSFRQMALSVVALAGVVASCRHPIEVNVRPGRAPRCDRGICVEIVSVRVNRPTIGMWMDAPAGTQLTDARLAKAATVPCSTGRSAEWVTLDGDVHQTGPADAGGSHGLVIKFPGDLWYVRQGENFIDLDLVVAGTHRCVRIRLTGPDSQIVVGS
jgi:hypothetical protein